MGVNVRVETNGASGVGTPLTAEEISKAVVLSGRSKTRQLKQHVLMVKIAF